MKIEVINSTSFYYLIMSKEIEFRKIDFINDFINCMNEYTEMCGCGGGEAKSQKLNMCEMKYIDIVSNNLDLIKNQLLELHDEIDFVSYHPQEKLLGNIKKN